MKAKKLFTLFVSAVILLSAVPCLFTAAGAVDVQGDWTVYRTPGSYIPNEDGSEKVVAPCPGYEYTDEGFSIVSPSWKDCTPFYTIQTLDKQSLRDGVYMQFRVDEYSYAGDNGADHWLAFSIWDSQNLNPGATKYGQGWIGLIYPLTGDVYSNVSTSSAFTSVAQSNVSSVKDEDGRELFDLEVSSDGAQYRITVNGVAVGGEDQVTAHLNSLDPNGEFYIGVTLYTGVRNGKGELTVTKFGASKADAATPKGSDSLKPEANNLVIADMADPATVPEGTPAMLWNSETVSKTAGESNMVLSPMGDHSYHCVASQSTCEFRWVIPNSVSYDGADFPVFAMLLRNYMHDGGHFFYCAGDELVPSTAARMTWSITESDCEYVEIEDDAYTLVILDLTDLWSGRIHQVVPGFNVLDESLNEWDVCYMGFFRTADEAADYGFDFLGVDFNEQETTAAVTVPASTEPPTETVADTQPAETESAATVTEPPAEGGNGCASALGAVTLVWVTAAAYVTLRKRS